MGVFDNKHKIDIVMELCDGGSVGQLLKKKGKLDERSVVNMMQSALSVISHAHSMNVLYRDVKPDNASAAVDLSLTLMPSF